MEQECREALKRIAFQLEGIHKEDLTIAEWNILNIATKALGWKITKDEDGGINIEE